MSTSSVIMHFTHNSIVNVLRYPYLFFSSSLGLPFRVVTGSAMTGKKGKDLYVKVPLGTIVKEKPVDYILVRLAFVHI